MRAFVAIVPPPAVRDQVHRAAADLRASDMPVRWVGADSLHITLVFLGQTEDARAQEILDAIAEVTIHHEPFDASLAGLGAFPRESDVRVVWAGVGEGGEQITELQQEVARALEGLGFPREARAFTPHLTLGRARHDARRVRLPAAAFELDASFRIDEVALMRSHMSPRGARYERVGGAALDALAAQR